MCIRDSPKTAPYPFTTLHPVIGVVEIGEYQRITVADIPGIIEGAHENKGLGHEFLRHIVRCKMLLFVLDMAGSEGRDPISDYQSLRKELRLYDPKLLKKKFAVIANKADIAGSADYTKAFRQKYPKVQVIEISALEKTGLKKIFQSVEI